MQCKPSQKPATIHNSSIRSDEGITLETSAFKSFAVVIRPLSTPLIKSYVHVSLSERRSISVSLETKILFLNETDFIRTLTVALERAPNGGQRAGIYFDAIFSLAWTSLVCQSPSKREHIWKRSKTTDDFVHWMLTQNTGRLLRHLWNHYDCFYSFWDHFLTCRRH